MLKIMIFLYTMINSIYRTVNGTTYYGIVKGKDEAAEEFEQRQQAGENVGLVESR